MNKISELLRWGHAELVSEDSMNYGSIAPKQEAQDLYAQENQRWVVQEERHSQLAKLESELFLKHILHCETAFLLSHPEHVLTASQSQAYFDLIHRRKQGEPVAYILGHQAFWSLDLKVTPDVLIPRADTEILVETILDQFPDSSKMRVLDLGTGSGAIALALVSERPSWEIVAADISEKALEVARSNAKRLGLSHVHFFCSNWYQNLPQAPFDIIVSNPPYIRIGDPHLKQGDLVFEPKTALIAGQDGLDDYRKILKDARSYLTSDGVLALEIGYDQADSLKYLAHYYGFEKIDVKKDLDGNNRVVLIRSGNF